MGLLARRKDKDNLPSPFQGEAYEETRKLLGAGRGDEALVYFTKIDLLSIKATEIKVAAARESFVAIERESASGFKGLEQDLIAIRNESDDELVRSLFTQYMAHSLQRTANTFDRFSEIAGAQMAEIISRPVDRRY